MDIILFVGIIIYLIITVIISRIRFYQYAFEIHLLVP